MLRPILFVSAGLLLTGCCSTMLDANFDNERIDEPPQSTFGINSIEYAAETESVRVIDTRSEKELEYQCPPNGASEYLRFVSTTPSSKDELVASWDGRFPGFGDQSTRLRIRLRDRQGAIGRIGAEAYISGAGDGRVTVTAGESEQTLELIDGLPVQLAFKYDKRRSTYTFSMKHSDGGVVLNAGAAPDADSVDFSVGGAKLEFLFDEGCGDSAAHIIDNVKIRECTKVRLGGA